MNTSTLTDADDVVGPIPVPRDSFVQAGVQYGSGGLGTIVLEITLNDEDWVVAGLLPIGGGAIVASLAAAGIGTADVSTASKVRVRKSVAGGGGVVVSLNLVTA